MPGLNIVPFGKYKGQPVEVLANDKPYLDWLQAQDWFRQRYAGIYTLIVNNFAEASETPDHNALQVLFLEDDFCARFAAALNPQRHAQALKTLEAAMRHNIKVVTQQRDALLARPAGDYYAEKTAQAIKTLGALLPRLQTVHWRVGFGREFESGGVDVRLWGSMYGPDDFPWVEIFGSYYGHSMPEVNRPVDLRASLINRTNIEIKPSVGDDYPAVLRQMRANRSDVLFTERYTGTGATESQFVKTLALSDIKVVFRRDVEAMPSSPLAGTIITKCSNCSGVAEA